MRNLFKKSLACCLAIALCLTAMVGLTVSAAEVAGTITVGEVTVEPGTATANVDITLSAAGLSEAILNVSTDAGTITAVTSNDVTATLATNGIKMALSTDGDSSVDTATATITVALADTETEKEYAVNVSIATAATVDEELITADAAAGKIIVKAAHVHVTGYTNNENGTHTTKCTADGCDGTFEAVTSDCTYVDGVCSACGYVEPVTGPDEDTNLKFQSAAISYGTSSLEFIFYIRNTVINLYDDMELVIIPEKYDLTTFNLVENPQEIVINKNDLQAMGSTMRRYIYSDMMLYELGLNITYMLRAYDANGELVAVSPTFVQSPANYLKTTFAGSDNANLRTLITDTLVVGNEAAISMSADYTDSDLYKATSIIEGFDISEATQTIDTYNSIDEHVAVDANFGDATTCTHRVRKGASIGKVPYISYFIKDSKNALDVNKLAYKVSYTQIDGAGNETPYEKIFTTENTTINDAAMIGFNFEEIGLQDSNATIVCEISYDGAVVATSTYSVETYLNSMRNDAKIGGLATALMKLGISFRGLND